MPLNGTNVRWLRPFPGRPELPSLFVAVPCAVKEKVNADGFLEVPSVDLHGVLDVHKAVVTHRKSESLPNGVSA